MCNSDKHTSLLQYGINYGRKKSYSTGPGLFHNCKYFLPWNVLAYWNERVNLLLDYFRGLAPCFNISVGAMTFGRMTLSRMNWGGWYGAQLSHWRHGTQHNGIQHNQWILKGEVSLYCLPPVWPVWNQLYDNSQFLFLFAKQTNPNLSNRRSMVQWYFPL